MIPILLVILVLVAFSLSRWVTASTVSSDDFSSGNFSNWSSATTSSGASQTVNSGVARFIVPPPIGGHVTYSYLIREGFTSTVNSTIVASQDIRVNQVPNGCVEGNGAIFFLYVCDSADLSGSLGNVGVGIDGSGVWSLWVGGNITYTYIFQTQGPPPTSNTWYHVALTLDNSGGLVSLTVDGRVVLSATQQQFTDRTHTFSLMSGLGEDWWSGGVGSMVLEVDNVRLDVSDATSRFTENPTLEPTSNSLNAATTAPTPVHASTPAPSVSVTVSPSSTQSPTPTGSVAPTRMQTTQESGFLEWLVVPVVVAVAVCGGVLFMLKKR